MIFISLFDDLGFRNKSNEIQYTYSCVLDSRHRSYERLCGKRIVYIFQWKVDCLIIILIDGKAYKRWNKLRRNGYRHLQLIDLEPSTQTMKQLYPKIHVDGMSRCSVKNKAYVYSLNETFIQHVMETLDGK